MKEIFLTKGKTVLVSDIDYKWLDQFKWTAGCSGGYWTAKRQITQNGIHKMITMHRLILAASKDLCVDHINGDGLDNRRSNLRLCTRSQNLQNQRPMRGKSKYKGVTPRGSRWVAQIRKDYKLTYLGTFDSEKEAAMIYDVAARRLFGRFALTNEQYEKSDYAVQ